MKSKHLRLVDTNLQASNLAIPFGSEVIFKALWEMMETPFCVLGKKKRFKPIEYKNGEIEILITSPQPWGIATIYDMDIMMWIASRITDKLNQGQTTSPVVEFTPYDCLKSLKRGTGDYSYKLFEEAINRLFYTHIVTTIRKEHLYLETGIKYTRGKTQRFHWIVQFEFTKEKTKSGKEKIKGIKLVLANWFYLGLMQRNSILQLANNYFVLKSGLDRALYLIARKHVGRQASWVFTMRQLYKKTGSDSSFADFARNIRKAVKRNILPEYAIMINRNKDGEEIVIFYYRPKLNPKNELWEAELVKGKQPKLIPNFKC